MSPLLKVLAVFVTIMSIVLVALVVPFVAKTQNYNDLLQEERTKSAAAQQKATSAESTIASVQRRSTEELSSMNSRINDLRGQVTRAEAARAEAEKQLSDLQSQINKREGEIARLTAAVEQQSKLVATYSEELKNALTETVSLKTDNIELRDTNNSQNAQLQALNRQVQQFKESTFAIEAELEELKNLWAQVPQDVKRLLAGGAAEDAGVAAAIPGRGTGQVTRVESTPDTTLVQLNIGSRDGVVENMEYMVHRGSSWIANIVVSKVDVAASAGEVVLIKEGESIQSGDGIRSTLLQ